MIRRLVTALWAALVCFHVYLLACQVVDGRLLDGGVLMRWCLAFGLAAGLLGMRRVGTSRWGRRALAPWLLAMLLHGPAVLDRAGVDMPAAPEGVAVVAGAAVSLGAGLYLLVLGLSRLRRHAAAAAASTRRTARGDATPLGSWAGLVVAARPPPLV